MIVTVVWGSTSSFFVTLPWQLKPYGFKSTDVAIVLLCANGLGLVGSIIIGLYVQKVKKYKNVLVLLISGSIVCVGIFWIFL